MPLFFFHLRTPKGLDLDDTGTDFPDLDVAYLDVCRAIPAMVESLLRDGHDPLGCAFEIVDERGRQVMEVPFAERLTKAASRHQPQTRTPRSETAILIDQISRTIERGQAEAARLSKLIQGALAIHQRLTGFRNAPSMDGLLQRYGLSTIHDRSE